MKPYFQIVSRFISVIFVVDFIPSSANETKVPSLSLFRHTRTSLCSVLSLLHVENQGRQHIPAIPQNLNAPRTILYAGLFPGC